MGKRLCIALAAGVLLPLAALALYAADTRIDPNPKHAVGEQLDELNGVAIYYNGGVNTVQGRNLTQDGYNLGLRRYGHVAIIASVGTDTLHARFHWVCSVSRQLIILVHGSSPCGPTTFKAAHCAAFSFMQDTMSAL